MLGLLRPLLGRGAVRCLSAAPLQSLTHQSITVQGKPVFYDQISSTHLTHIAAMDRDSVEYPLAHKAAVRLFTSGQLPPIQTDSFAAMMKIFDGAEDLPKRDKLYHTALANVSRITDRTLSELVSISCSTGLESLRSTVSALSASHRTLAKSASQQVADYLLSKGSDEDYLIVYELYKQHVLLLPPTSLVPIAKVLAKKHMAVDLCYLASLFHIGFPHIHYPFAKIFREIGDVEHALQQYHQHYDAALEDPLPLDTFQFAKKAEDVSLMEQASLQAFKQGCSLEDATSILTVWTLDLKNKKRADEFQKAFPELLGSIHIEIPEPPKKK